MHECFYREPQEGVPFTVYGEPRAVRNLNKRQRTFITVASTVILPASTDDRADSGARTYMHWTAVSAARGASRAAELAAKVTSAQDVLPTSGLLATAMEMPNIDRILAVNITV